ncbi:two-component system, AgrA family, response regulator AgrA [Evansella caseinilytica]|uniref:Two-component system, AgrA family, response regulator AgrA n=1 Tax=Evansella caseinilytica TaxID=1503961 RepID=A0A1H3V0L9_9BACI|nr:LytTR family DNA-binding domain-containing protein [Evansella caseinilytica]SDZ68253.1 two-component system, AgrA family, response regulator AgrA [Evansella caseinilytica]
MKVIICENEVQQRKFLQSVIFNYAMFSEPSIEVVLSASQPEEVLAYLQDHRADCYFLDIELGSSISGMDLASIIREQDPLANIIFITMHADKLKLTFKYKLAALDFIVKDVEPEKLTQQVKEALQASFAKYQQLGNSYRSKFFQIKIGERIKNINLDDIYYLETSAQVHKIGLHEKNGCYEFYGKLKELENLDERFYRCHKSYIVNLQHVKYIDKKNRKLTMANDEVCYVSTRMIKELQSKIAKLNSIVQNTG